MDIKLPDLVVTVFSCRLRADAKALRSAAMAVTDTIGVQRSWSPTSAPTHGASPSTVAPTPKVVAFTTVAYTGIRSAL